MDDRTDATLPTVVVDHSAVDAEHRFKRCECFSVTVIGVDKDSLVTTKIVRVRADDGSVSLPLLSRSVRVEGLTEVQAQKAISKAYADSGFDHAEVSIPVLPG